MSIEQKLNELVEGMRAKADSANVIDKNSFEAMKAELKSELQALREEQARKNAPKAFDAKEEIEQVKEAIAPLFVKGGQGFDTKTAEELNFAVDAQGGFTLPRILAPEVTDILRMASPLLGMASVRRGGGNYSILMKDSKTEARTRAELEAWVTGETATYAELTLGRKLINC